MPKRKCRKNSRTASVSSLESTASETLPASEHASNQATEGLASVSDVGNSDQQTVCSSSSDEPAQKKIKADETEGESVFDSTADGSIPEDLDSTEVKMEEQNEDSDLSDVESDGSEGSDYEEYMDADEIDALLDQGMVDYKTKANEQQEPVEKEKVVLIEKVNNPFEVLPDGWVVVSHNSGMPLFLHRASRVCTMSKPYFLGSGSARNHEIPVSAIPCLEYRKALEKEQEDLENKEEKVIEDKDSAGEKGDSEKPTPTPLICAVELKVAEEHNKENSLDPEAVRKYCETIFQFKTIKFKRYNTWKERRINMKKEKRKSRPTLPSNTKLITCPLPSGNAEDKSNRKKEFFLNLEGKTPVCLMHEYVQRVLRQQPKYVYKDTDTALTPYSATVIINGIEYGTGLASNKRQAKQEAAKKALSVLMPDVKEFGDQKEKESNDLSFFEEIKIEDPRVKDLSTRAGQNGPFTILLECLKRNYGLGNTDIHIEMNTLKNQKCEYTMTAGKHTTTVVCKNKRDGKQQAAQALLQLLHPHFNNWGSLLRLYGKTNAKIQQEKKDAETQVSECEHVPVSVDNGTQMEECQTVMHDSETQVVQATILDIGVQVGHPISVTDAFIQASTPPPKLTQSRVIKHVIPAVAGPRKRDIGSQCFVLLQDRSSQVSDDADFLGDCWCVSRETKVHHVTQTEWLGMKYFHKATQEPEETTFIKTSRGANYAMVSHLGMEDKVTETDWTGSSMFHKATQFPDVTYSSEDQEGQAPKTTRASSPNWPQRLSQLSAPPQYQMRPHPQVQQRFQIPPMQMMQAPMYSNPYGMAPPMYPNYQYYPGMYMPQNQSAQPPPADGYGQENPPGQ